MRHRQARLLHDLGEGRAGGRGSIVRGPKRTPSRRVRVRARRRGARPAARAAERRLERGCPAQEPGLVLELPTGSVLSRGDREHLDPVLLGEKLDRAPDRCLAVAEVRAELRRTLASPLSRACARRRRPRGRPAGRGRRRLAHADADARSTASKRARPSAIVPASPRAAGAPGRRIPRAPVPRADGSRPCPRCGRSRSRPRRRRPRDRRGTAVRSARLPEVAMVPEHDEPFQLDRHARPSPVPPDAARGRISPRAAPEEHASACGRQLHHVDTLPRSTAAPTASASTVSPTSCTRTIQAPRSKAATAPPTEAATVPVVASGSPRSCRACLSARAPRARGSRFHEHIEAPDEPEVLVRRLAEPDPRVDADRLAPDALGDRVLRPLLEERG